MIETPTDETAFALTTLTNKHLARLLYVNIASPEISTDEVVVSRNRTYEVVSLDKRGDVTNDCHTKEALSDDKRRPCPAVPLVNGQLSAWNCFPDEG